MPGELQGLGLVAQLLNSLFTWATGPDGWEQLSIERKVQVIHAGIQVAQAKGETAAVDALFAEYRELSKRVGT
jgi:hypothetical protein